MKVRRGSQLAGCLVLTASPASPPVQVSTLTGASQVSASNSLAVHQPPLVQLL